MSDYNEHLISMAGGDGEADPLAAVAEYVRQRKLLSKDLGPVVHGVFSDPEAEMADLTVDHLEALLAMVRELELRVAKAWEDGYQRGSADEVAHANYLSEQDA
jgi:hypothetical protein